MRFAKFFFALLFGLVFFLTLFKVLFFGLFAALLIGGVFMSRRAFGYRRINRYQHNWASPYDAGNSFEPFQAPHQAPFEQAVNPNWQKRPSAPAFGHRIEVQ
jgi:hypothetical protein